MRTDPSTMAEHSVGSGVEKMDSISAGPAVEVDGVLAAAEEVEEEAAAAPCLLQSLARRRERLRLFLRLNSAPTSGTEERPGVLFCGTRATSLARPLLPLLALAGGTRRTPLAFTSGAKLASRRS